MSDRTRPAYGGRPAARPSAPGSIHVAGRPVREHRKARALAKAVRRLGGMFPPAAQLITLTSHRDRALLLLQLPDQLLADNATALSDGCRVTGFADGLGYVLWRASAVMATRTDAGELPPDLAARLDLWRRGLVALAGGAS